MWIPCLRVWCGSKSCLELLPFYPRPVLTRVPRGIHGGFPLRIMAHLFLKSNNRNPIIVDHLLLTTCFPDLFAASRGSRGRLLKYSRATILGPISLWPLTTTYRNKLPTLISYCILLDHTRPPRSDIRWFRIIPILTKVGHATHWSPRTGASTMRITIPASSLLPMSRIPYIGCPSPTVPQLPRLGCC